MHARRNGGAVDYSELFSALAKVSPVERMRTLDDRLVAIPILDVEDGKVHLVAYEGPTDQQPIILKCFDQDHYSILQLGHHGR